MDCHLKMDEHVSQICRTAYYHLHNIRRVRHYITTEAAEMLVHAFVTTKLDLNNALLYGITEGLLDKVQRVQNTAARIVTRSSKYCRLTSLLRSLHWLPVRYRIQYKINLLTYKALNGLAPCYLADLIHKHIPSRDLRSSTTYRLEVPLTKLVTVGDRAFSKSAPDLWNDLPLELQHSASLSSFMRQLKIHPFTKAYGDCT